MKGLIEDVKVKKLNVIPDERGYLMECFRSDWPTFKKFGQAYITVGYPNVVKAWHYHKIQTDNFICIKGNAKVVLCDNRKDSSTYKKINEFFMGEKNPILLTIPNHVWHGFKAIGGKEAVILNCPTELYNYDNPDEYRLPYNAKEIGYDWEIKMG